MTTVPPGARRLPPACPRLARVIGAIWQGRWPLPERPGTSESTEPPPGREEETRPAFPPPARDGAPRPAGPGGPGALARGWARGSVAPGQGRWPLPGCPGRGAPVHGFPAFRPASPCGRHLFTTLSGIGQAAAVGPDKPARLGGPNRRIACGPRQPVAFPLRNLPGRRECRISPPQGRMAGTFVSDVAGHIGKPFVRGCRKAGQHLAKMPRLVI